MRKENSSFLNSALIVAIAGFLIKILGAFYKIQLGKPEFLGEIGASYIGFVYPYYNTMLIIATAGVPSAVAKLMSSYDARGMHRENVSLFVVVRILMLVLSVVFALILFFMAEIICTSLRFEAAIPVMKAISLAILFVPNMAAYRGYFQAHQKLRYFAISQFVEQLARVGFGLLLAKLFLDRGLNYGAAGAISGNSVGAILSFLFLYISYKFYKKKEKDIKAYKINLKMFLKYSKKTLYYAIPITIGASIIPLVEIIDGIFVKKILMQIGYSEIRAQVMFGYHSYFAESLINFPIIIFVAVQLAVLPAVSKLHALGDKEKLRNTINSAIKIILIVSMAASFGILAIPKQILEFLWPSQLEMVAGTYKILRILAIALVPVSIYQISSAMLQGMSEHIKVARNLLIGLVFKTLLSYTLLHFKEINILAASISNLAAFMVASSLNVITLRNKCGLKYNLIFRNYKILFPALLMGISVFSFKLAFASKFQSKVFMFLAIIIAVIIYLSSILLMKIFDKEDLEFLPMKSFLKKFTRNSK